MSSTCVSEEQYTAIMKRVNELIDMGEGNLSESEFQELDKLVDLAVAYEEIHFKF